MRIRIYIAAILTAIAMTACHTGKQAVATDISSGSSTTVTKPTGADKKPVADKSSVYSMVDRKSLDSTTQSLFDEADTWLGTPYLWGGNTRNGVDCSGFVLQVYKTAANIALPRVSYEQYNFCTPIGKSELQPGDLVFFATSNKRPGVSHVGLYIGNNHMIHASSKKGVMIADINSSYYTTHYYGSGRVERFHAMRKEHKSQKTDVAKSQSSTPKKKVDPKKTEEKTQQKVEKKQQATDSKKKKEKNKKSTSKPQQPTPVNITTAPAHHALHGNSAPASSSATTTDYRKSVLDNLDK